MDQLSPQDAQFLYMESADNLTHVTSISIFDQTTVPDGKVVRFKDILAHIEGRLHMSPLFKRRLVRVPFELDLMSISTSSTTSGTVASPSPATGASFVSTWRVTTRGRWI
jgi:hypothetical protein